MNLNAFHGDRVRDVLDNAFRNNRFFRYCRSKSWAQGMLDIALMVVNAAHLTNVIRKGPTSQPLYYTTISVVGVSIALEVIIIMMLFVKERNFDINDPDQHASLDLFNNVLVWAVFISSVVHVFAAVFVDEHHYVISPSSNSSKLVGKNCPPPS